MKMRVRKIMLALGLSVLAALAPSMLVTRCYSQTFAVIHNFTGADDGGVPYAGVSVDSRGTLYGTASFGGDLSCGQGDGCGVVFKMQQHNSAWTFTSLYTFHGGSDGAFPEARVVFGPDGRLYGTTYRGGGSEYCISGCGTAFSVTPPATVCVTVSCPWAASVLYSFDLQHGAFPYSGDLTFDSAGNVYGTTLEGGGYQDYCAEYGCGTVYKLSRSGNSWTETLLFQFSNGSGNQPETGVIFDTAGNLYGTTSDLGGGGQSFGTVYKLSPGTPWTQTILHNFSGQSDGAHPFAGLITDPSGNLYGSTTTGGSSGGGTVYEMVSSGGSWTFNLVYPLPSRAGGGPYANLAIDSSGNLYGTTYADGAYGHGNVFKLTRSMAGWTYSSLHDFTGGTDGGYPESTVVFDQNGNLYGTALAGGSNPEGCIYGNGCGVVWEITQ